jgi:hypothetical protein
MRIGDGSLMAGAIGFVAFTLLLLAQIYLFEERMIVDTAVSTFIIGETHFFDITENRITVGINQVLPVIVSQFSPNVKWIMVAYYANDYLWYLGFFLLFLVKLKQPAAALALVLGYFSLATYNYFILTYCVALTWPIILLLVLILKHQALATNFTLRWLTICVCTFCLAFSSPIVTIVVMLFFAWLLAKHWHEHASRLQILTALSLFFFFVITKHAEPNAYDVDRATTLNYQSLFNLNWPYFKTWCAELKMLYPLGLLLLLFGFFISVGKILGNKKWAGVMLLGGFAYLLTVFMLYGIFAKSPYDELPGKAFAPMFLVCSYLISRYLIDTKTAWQPLLKIAATIVIIILLTMQYQIIVNKYSVFPKKKIALCKELISTAPNGGGRHFIREENYRDMPIMASINAAEIIIFSELMDNKPFTSHIVVADSSELADLMMIDNDELFHMKGSFFKVHPNNRIFHFKTDTTWAEFKPILTVEY